MSSRRTLARGLPFGFLLLLVLVAAGPLLWLGIPRGHDWMHELVRVGQFRAALADGQVPPAWAPDLYGGWGSPIFLYYAPLFALLVAGLGALLPSTAAGLQASVVLLLGVGAAGAYAAGSEASRFGWLGERVSPRWRVSGSVGRVAAALFLLHPYFLADLYLRNAFAELTALCLAPWLLTGLLVAERAPRRAAVGLALTGTGLILAHNLSALLFAALVGVATLALFRLVDPAGRIAVGAAALGGGLAISATAWFWWPAMSLTPLVRTEELTSGKFAIVGNFVSLGTTVGWSPIRGVGPVFALALVGALIGSTKVPRGTARRLRWGLLAAAGVLLLMMQPLSLALWDTLPLLPLFQFPWRLLGALGLVTAVAGGLAFGDLTSSLTPGRRRWVEMLVFGIAVVNALPTLISVRPLPVEVVRDLDWALSAPVVRDSGQRATVGDEYLPRAGGGVVWAKKRAEVARAMNPDARLELASIEGTELRFELDTPAATAVEVDRWFFPGWTATVHGHTIPLEEGPEGRISLRLPAGRHEVTVDYRQPGARRRGLLVSAMVTLCLGLLIRRLPGSVAWEGARPE